MEVEMEILFAKREFIEKFGNHTKKIFVYFAPGRVNLIGEHTDYNGGYVFPCALNFGTYLVIHQNNSDQIRMATTNFRFEATVSTRIIVAQGKHWINYPMGVMDQFIKRGFSLCGMDMMYSGTVPNSAGLSSSASIEMVTAFALNDILGFNLEMMELIKLSQKAENEFVGVNCGIMDQFASGMGKKDHAIFINCKTLDYQAIPLNPGNHKIIISNTNKRRGLASSKYNERRSQCESAVKMLSQAGKIDYLGDLSLQQFHEIQHLIDNETILKRARHVISENQRVLDAIDALQSDNLVKFGELMNESHDSLRDDYEVTGIELDTLVEEARKVDGVLGSRMTGAGFGGCTVSVVHNDAIDSFKSSVGLAYKAKLGLKPDFYIAEIGDGARRLE
jgi:galactokinase